MEFDIKEIVLGVVQNLVAVTLDQAPRVLTALVVIIIGVIIAKLIERVLRGTLRRLRFDSLLERVGVQPALARLGLRQSPSVAISRLIYLLLVVLFVQSATLSVGLTTFADAIGSFFAYLPNLISAVVIALMGSIIAQFVGNTVARAASEAGVDFASSLGRVVSAAIMFVVALMAIGQLKIDTAIINTFVFVALSGLALTMALSFGLGSRGVTRSIVAGYYLRKIFEVGRPIEIKGQRGKLTAITPTSTLIDVDGRTVAISNSTLLDEVVEQPAAES